MTLLEAVERGELEAFKTALATATDLNQLGEGRRTPLILAAGAGRLAMVQALLEAGAETEWRDDTDETAMLKAAANGHRGIAQLLAPYASEDDRGLASSFLKAFGASHGPEFQQDAPSLKRKAVEVAARAANFVGDEDPLSRLQRLERAEQNEKKKR